MQKGLKKEDIDNTNCNICPLSKILPDKELHDFVQSMRQVRDEVRIMQTQMPKSKPWGTIISLLVSIILIGIGWAYSAGTLSESVKSNCIAISTNAAQITKLIDLHNADMIKVYDEIGKNKIEIARSIVTISTMADDVKTIKTVIIDNMGSSGKNQIIK